MVNIIPNIIVKIDNALLNSKIIRSAAHALVGHACSVVLAMQKVTRTTVRLYSLEGVHLSRRDGEQKRLTWYTDPATALEIGEYMGALTGKMVYVDLELDYCSDYSYRFYKQGNAAYTLKGQLINISKRKWKYVRVSAQAAATRETNR